MTSEEQNGVNMDDFMDDTPEADQTEEVDVTSVEPDEPKQDDKELAKDEKSTVSVTDLIGGEATTKDGSGYVPLDDHIKLRHRAQEAERKLKDLEEYQQTHTEADNSGLLDDYDPDDYVTAKDLTNFAAKIKADAINTAKAERQSEIAAAKITKAKADQDLIASEREDYYNVIESLTMLELSPKVREQIANSDNAAATAYEIGCKLLNRQPAPQVKSKKTPSKENETNADDLDDDELFEDLYGG